MTGRLLLASSFLLALCVSCTCAQNHSRAVGPEEAPEAASPAIEAQTEASRPSSELNRTSPLGSNINTVVDYGTDMPFVDLFRSSRPWISGTERQWNDRRPIDLDEHGWVRSLRPGQIARTLMLNRGGHPGGEFVVLYDGKGKLEYSGQLVPNQSQPGRHVVRVKPNGAVRLEILATDSRDPIRNIRVLPPGGSCEQDDARWCDRAHPCAKDRCVPFERTYEERIFHPKFLQSMSRYAVLRFMDWMRTNDSTVRTWSERPKVTDATWSRKGVPIEVMMALSTRLRAEPWVNIPHLADDDYVSRFASLALEALPDDFRVWVEYSNEVWNSQFSQHREVAQCPAGKNATGKRMATLVCQAERTDEVFRSWRQVFGKSASRVVRVVGSQASVPWVTETLLTHRKLHERVDALAIAPYFGLIAKRENEDEIAGLSLNALLQTVETERLPKAVKHMKEQAELAKRFGLALVAYEGGQHFASIRGAENNDRINALFDAINRDPRMKDLYLRYLTAWRDAGGQLFVHYNNCSAYDKWGRWGLQEYIDQPREKAPKYDAVMQFIDDNPRWW